MTRPKCWSLSVPAALAAALLLASACLGGRRQPALRQVPGGDAARGSEALVAYGCGGCHQVPGVRRAVGKVAPPLGAFGQRGFIAGILSNNAENLIRWIQRPREIDPRTAMPDLGVTEEDARDIAAYLYSLD